MRQPPKEGPLAGIRILDFTWAWAGPHGTTLLALLGAEVIKVESRKRLDHTRLRSLMAGPVLASPDPSVIFSDLNVGKLSIPLDLKQPRAVEIARRVATVCDVVTANMRPGTLERLGLGYEDLRAVKPDIIMLCSSAVGDTGPERSYVGYAPTFAALAGISSITGHSDSAPSPLSGAIDLRVGTTCALAILAAVYHRRRTGEGQYIDLSSTEAVSALIGSVFVGHSMNGRVPGRQANRHPTMAPHNCYPCQPEGESPVLGEQKRSWVSIAVGSDEEWRALCSVLGEGGLDEDPRFADVVSRWRHQEELDDIISTWTRDRTAGEAAETLQKMGVAAMPVLDGAALAQDAHLRERGVLVNVEHPVIGSRIELGPPWTLSDTPAAIRRPAPRLGEHNDYVLGQLLGMSGQDIEELVREGVVS